MSMPPVVLGSGDDDRRYKRPYKKEKGGVNERARGAHERVGGTHEKVVGARETAGATDAETALGWGTPDDIILPYMYRRLLTYVPTSPLEVVIEKKDLRHDLNIPHPPWSRSCDESTRGTTFEAVNTKSWAVKTNDPRKQSRCT